MSKQISGQMSIFDFLGRPTKEKSPPKATLVPGEWVKQHGKRVFFDDIQEKEFYIADYSTTSHKWYKIIYVKRKTEDMLFYVDSPDGIKGPYSYGKSYSCSTRKQYVDAAVNEDLGMAGTSGFWYEIESAVDKSRPQDKLREKGFKNKYDEVPAQSDIYEVVDIENPDKIKYSHFTAEGYYKGNWTVPGDGNYTWWRNDTRDYKRKPLIWHMGLSAYYYECPYCKAQNSEQNTIEGTYCKCCFKYFNGVIDRKTKDYIECENQLGAGGGAVYKDDKGWHYSDIS